MDQQLTETPQVISDNMHTKQWQKSLTLLGLSLMVWGVAYWPSLASMVEIWWVNDTFNHGFLILPISAWLIWRDRAALRILVPAFWWYGLLLICGLSVLWLIADLVAIQAVQHLAVVSMVPVLVLIIVGLRVAKIIWFPLFFLLFAAPVGDFLVPPLMELTAWFSVEMLKLTGFPVLKEGMLITIPSGVFQVEHACSGISYLIASVVLGSVYAHLNYRSLWRKSLFVLMSVLVPLIANGFRAFGIIMLAHYSDYTVAVGFDHLIYGGVFFGFVMLILFWLGSYWVDAPVKVSSTASEKIQKNHSDNILNVTHTAAVWFGIFPLMALLVGPIAQVTMFSTSQHNLEWAKKDATLLNRNEQFRKIANVNSRWAPEYPGATKTELMTYQYQQQTFSLFIASYAEQTQGSELISDENRLYDPELWRSLQTSTHEVVRADQSIFEYKEIRLLSNEGEHLIAYWYQIGSYSTVNPAIVKLYEAWNKFSGQKGSTVVAIAVDYDNSETSGQLKKIVVDMAPNINQQLQSAWREF